MRQQLIEFVRADFINIDGLVGRAVSPLRQMQPETHVERVDVIRCECVVAGIQIHTRHPQSSGASGAEHKWPCA